MGRILKQDEEGEIILVAKFVITKEGQQSDTNSSFQDGCALVSFSAVSINNYTPPPPRQHNLRHPPDLLT